MLNKLKIGESHTESPKNGKHQIIANFQKRGEVFEAMEFIAGALAQTELRGKNGFQIKPGESVTLIDARKREAQFRVLKIIARMPILVDPSDRSQVGLFDRLLLAWQIFTGKFFKK